MILHNYGKTWDDAGVKVYESNKDAGELLSPIRATILPAETDGDTLILEFLSNNQYYVITILNAEIFGYDNEFTVCDWNKDGAILVAMVFDEDFNYNSFVGDLRDADIRFSEVGFTR